MPELPEVETIRLGLAPRLLGAQIRSARVTHLRTARRQVGGADRLAGELAGRRVEAVARRGKFLWFTLDGGGALLAHLGMSGQFRIFDAPTDPPHERARLDIEQPGGSRAVVSFCDQRTFGYLACTEQVETDDGGPGGLGTSAPVLPAPVAHIARDLLDPALDIPGLARQLAGRSRAIKTLLLDQTQVSGIGNIYADESLWRAQVSGEMPANRLGAARLEQVLDAARTVMLEALKAGGTSFDPLYVNVNGSSGYFSRSLSVYGQQGRPCPRCGTPIVRERFMNRSSHFCPRCQRNG